MSKKLFTTISILVAAVAAYLLFFSGIMPKKTRIVFVTTENMTLKDLCADFNEENSDIKLDIVFEEDYNAEEYVESGRADIWLPYESRYLYYAEDHFKYDRGYQLYGRFTKIAFTPMIFVSGKERYAQTSKMSLQEIYNNIAEKATWYDINGKAGWGRFKFECPEPHRYEEGSDCISLFMHHYFISNGDPRGKIGLKELDNEGLKEHIKPLMENIIMRSRYENSFLYDFFDNPDDPTVDTCAAYEQTFLNTIAYDSREWSKVRIHYTKELTISKPIYLVSMSKSLNDSKKAEAIKRFEDFLLREDVQQELIGLGYRPVKTTAAIEAELAGLEEKYGDYGFQAELPELRDSLDYSFLREFQDTISKYIPER